MNNRATEPLPNTYETTWYQFRVWNYIGACSLFLFFGAPAIAAAYLPSVGEFFVRPSGWTQLYIVFAAVLFVGCAIRQQLLRCPRCGDYFFRETLMSTLPIHNENFRKHRCVHCGLKLYGHTE